jgi:hypothetical protein
MKRNKYIAIKMYLCYNDFVAWEGVCYFHDKKRSLYEPHPSIYR